MQLLRCIGVVEDIDCDRLPLLEPKQGPGELSIVRRGGDDTIGRNLDWACANPGVLSAVAVWIVAQLGIGITVRGAAAALVAALVIGFINATFGLLLKILTFPLTLLTLGVFWFV